MLCPAVLSPILPNSESLRITTPSCISLYSALLYFASLQNTLPCLAISDTAMLSPILPSFRMSYFVPFPSFSALATGDAGRAAITRRRNSALPSAARSMIVTSVASRDEFAW